METLNLLPIIAAVLALIVFMIFRDLYNLRKFSNSLNRDKVKEGDSFFKYAMKPSKERYNEQ